MTPAQAEAAAAMARELLARGEPVRLIALGGSMRPLIQAGDRLLLSPLGADPPRLGEVVLRAGPGATLGPIHRIVARRGARWLLKGDALPACDGWFPRDQLLARLTAIERAGRPIPCRRWRGVLLSLTLGLARGRLPGRAPP